MAVEYHASKVTNMDTENSKIGYRQFFTDGSKLQHSVFTLKNSPFRIATLCLGLLSLFLLAGIIGQSLHYQKKERDHQDKQNIALKEKQVLQEDLKTEKKLKADLDTVVRHMRDNYDYITKKNSQTQANNDLLTAETVQLKQSQSQLQASSTALSKELEDAKSSIDDLQTDNNALTTGKILLQKQYDSVLTRKNDLQASYDSVKKDRDILQNRYNNATRLKEKMQTDYNNLIKDVEHLQDRYNISTNEKDKIENSHQNLSIAMEAMQASYNILTKATDELRASNTALIQEKNELTNSCKVVTVERDQMKLKNDNLTAERDQLQVEIQRMTLIIHQRECPTGWKKSQGSCYYSSKSSKNWNMSREYCQNRGADLAIIKSQEEMIFINSLYRSDKEVWIGLSKFGADNQWKWVDGTPLTTTFWGKNQPNSLSGRNQNCVEFWHHGTQNGSWNDENCNLKQYFICEM